MAANKKPDKTRDKWLNRIADEGKAHEPWRKRAQDAEKQYCDYALDAKSPNYPVFYTTINLMLGKINGRPPKPDVRKRHPSSPVQSAPAAGGAPSAAPALAQGVSQPNGAAGGMQPPPQAQQNIGGQVALGQMQASGAGNQLQAVPPSQSSQLTDDNIIAMCLERCLSFTIDTTSFANDGALGVRDYLVTGLGACKIEMETETDEVPVEIPFPDPANPGQMIMQPVLDEKGEPVMTTEIVSQELHLRHFHWSLFRWEPNKDWRNVKWVSFDHYMTKDDVEDQFDVEIEEGTEAQPGTATKTDSNSISIKPPQRDQYEQTYLVHEIWDKRKRKRLFVSECYDKVLDEEDDPLGLDTFFPCPPPMFANVNGRELVPSPDYWQYANLVEQCGTLSTRIKKITEQVKDIKFYDKSFGNELKQASQYEDGTFIAVTSLLDRLRSLNGKADTSSIICELDMKNKVEVLQVLSQQLDTLKGRIYEINGISDIQRGVSNPNDTATAQNIKNEWADIRTGQRVQTVALFYRDIFRIMSELIATKFDRAQIQAMSGIQLSDAQIEVMRSDLATAYSIDVESDSTMTVNDSQNVAELTAFLQAFEPLLSNILPGIQSGAVPADLGKELINLTVDTYKPGRDLQQAVEALPSTMAQLQMLGQRMQRAEQQAQAVTQQLNQYKAGEEARKNAATQADVQNKAAQTNRTQAETALLTPADARKREAEALQATVAASQASRADLMEAAATGIQ